MRRTPLFGAAAALGALALTAMGAPAQADSPAATGGQNYTHSCAAPGKGRMACLVLTRTDVGPQLGVAPNLAAPRGLGPKDLQGAYGLPADGGAGATVAIVDAYDDPNAAKDLDTYRTQYGLGKVNFQKVNQDGKNSPLPKADSGWATEISLDLDMVSAIAPKAKILLVESNDNSMESLGAAVNTAVKLGAKYVSNSYGGDEDSTDPDSDSKYFKHPGVAITVSTGDSGYGVEYPAASQYVTAIGGTTLNKSSGGRGWTEQAWNGAGSGCSKYTAKPSWQTGTTGCAKKANADVSAVADPNTGPAIYDSYQQSGWMVVGGTSASSPIIAAVYALAGTPGASDYPATYPWKHSTALNDVTIGSNGSCTPKQLCSARAGWDGPTGWGTPKGTAAFKP